MSTALIISHPGHELRVFHWLEQTRPLVLVLTDGSGSANQARIRSTTRILKMVGARAGLVYGVFTDREIYSKILKRSEAILVQMLEELAGTLVDPQIDTVAGDALEGYNPSHDLCRYLINAAVLLAGRRTGKVIQNLDFALIGRPDACPAHLLPSAVRLCLDEAALERKLQAAEQYAELKPEVEAALNSVGQDGFRYECLRPVEHPESFDPPQTPPFYERHGEKRVREGVYNDVIRYREHLRPVAELFWNYAALA
ncbi:MAG TPA: hypothetical protein VJ063_17845 [Verrucomicrobiae bacterium]|nr:hypothetical protein [Verrucomicrobiae bacterium]